ncbi:MAG: hypothetical protein GY826_31140 [Fuerstiella sp.]|nr:hypothetical protein [Fuerstiella sp.]
MANISVDLWIPSDTSQTKSACHPSSGDSARLTSPTYAQQQQPEKSQIADATLAARVRIASKTNTCRTFAARAFLSST